MSRHRWTLALALLGTATCGGEAPTGPETGTPTNIAFDPSAPGASFVPAPTQAEQQSLIQEMWSTLTAPACWDASAIVQAAQPVGNVAQFQFQPGYEYRFVGTSTFFGAIILHDVGRYRGMRAAIVETWTGEVEAIVIVEAQEMAHVYLHLDGSITVLRYGPSNGPCL